MKRFLSALAAAGLVAAAGCSDTIVATVNLPSADALSGPLTAANARVLTLGVLANDRALVRADLTYLVLTEIYARDAYRIDPNEPRYVTETLTGTPDPGGFSGSGGWTNGYVTIRAANTLLDKLPTASAEITAGQNAALSGFIRTIKALEYYRLLELRDTLGIALQPADPNATGAIICKTSALTYIAALLDSANADLAAAGAASLPFALPTGFTAFGRNYTQAANIILLNRGLKGKVDLYRALDHQAPKPTLLPTAVAELTQALGGAAPGAVATSSYKTGAYVTFVAGGTENAANPLFDNLIGVNPKAVTAFDSLDPGKTDTRRAKIIPFSTGKTIAGSGISSNLTYSGASTAVGANQTAPIAILRNEELVLLRAQANFEAGNLAAGYLDLNSVHRNYQTTDLVAPATLAEARRVLLFEKRFSLFFEGPQRLVDLRAYGLLKAGTTTAETASDTFNNAFPITKTEADVRGGREFLAPSCS